jgi:hypothetical protein
MTETTTLFGYIAAKPDTPEQERTFEQRQKLASDDNAAWLRSFDKDGRWHDPVSGFWESLNSEIRNPDGTWETITEEECYQVA